MSFRPNLGGSGLRVRLRGGKGRGAEKARAFDEIAPTDGGGLAFGHGFLLEQATESPPDGAGCRIGRSLARRQNPVKGVVRQFRSRARPAQFRAVGMLVLILPVL